MTYSSETLIREALVREIRDAKRWQTIEEAWEALLTVRRMADERQAEVRGPCICEIYEVCKVCDPEKHAELVKKFPSLYRRS